MSRECNTGTGRTDIVTTQHIADRSLFFFRSVGRILLLAMSVQCINAHIEINCIDVRQ